MPKGQKVITWKTVLTEGARIVASYSTAVTLRQLHYRLVAASVGGYHNVNTAYKTLSSQTSEARRVGSFPRLSDTGRMVDRPNAWDSLAEALDALADQYRRDRTEDQKYQTWVLYEKATLSAQLREWTTPFGVPIAALRGYSSESLERDIFNEMGQDGRPAIVYYLGDLDPEGEDIERNFIEQATRMSIEFHHWEKLAVTESQIAALGLVANPGKPSSARAPAFIAKYGRLFQIELEAVDPAELERLITVALTDDDFHDADAYDAVVAAEEADRRLLRDLADTYAPEDDDDDD